MQGQTFYGIKATVAGRVMQTCILQQQVFEWHTRVLEQTNVQP